ncbi:MAG: hypothetical protein ABIM42_07565 [candidate division WOR-3 bacterium]
MPLLNYRGYEVITRAGREIIIAIKGELSKEEVKGILEGEYDYLFILNEYRVRILGRSKSDGSTFTPMLDVGFFRGYTSIFRATEPQLLDFEIPVTSKLIDLINEIRRKGMIVTLEIRCNFSLLRLSSVMKIVPRIEEYVYKVTPTGKNHLMWSFQQKR